MKLFKFYNYLYKKLLSSYLFSTKENFKSNSKLTVGRYTYGEENIAFQAYKGSYSEIEIGSFCSIGPEVKIIVGGVHPINKVSLYPFRIRFGLEGAYQDGVPSSNGPITIGNDVWISTGVTILSGIKIGHGAVVAAGTLLTKDVPPYAVVGGCPSEIIKYRFRPDQIDDLLQIAWWNWTIDRILLEVQSLNDATVEEFISIHKNIK